MEKDYIGLRQSVDATFNTLEETLSQAAPRKHIKEKKYPITNHGRRRAQRKKLPKNNSQINSLLAASSKSKDELRNPTPSTDNARGVKQSQRTVIISGSTLTRPKRSDDSKDTMLIQDKLEKEKSIRKGVKKRNERMAKSRKQRDKIEKERLRKFEANSSVMRQKRLRKRATDKKTKKKMIDNWRIYITLASRIQSTLLIIQRFRAFKQHLHVQDISARVITRQMRVFRFRQYRKRVKGAMQIIGIVLLVKVRLWKESRRRVGCDNIRAFLLALERENRSSGGCLALIVKGKKWRAYRQKIIILQRLWRQRLAVTEAQATLIDYQWRNAQDLQTTLEAENIFKEEESVCIAESDRLEAINRTRKLIKLRPLPIKQCRTMSEIKQELIKGKDILSIGNIVPSEIRNSLIRDTLRYLRQMHIQDLKAFEIALKEYQIHLLSMQRRRALLVNFSGNKVANAWVSNGQESNRCMKSGDHQMQKCFNIPSKPFFRAILCRLALEKLMEVGAAYVKNIRKAWKPENMELEDLYYDSKAVAKIQKRKKGSQRDISL